MTASPALPLPAIPNKGRVLIIGAAGLIGHFVAEASLATGFPTYLLVRQGLTAASKLSLVKSLQDKGAIVIHGVMNDKEFMEKILKDYEIEIVVSAIGGTNLLDQLVLVEAMKSVKTIKRFLPSEFGHDVDRADPVEPGLAMYKSKRLVRRMVEQSGVPYTYICCNSIASWPYYNNCHPSRHPPPLDQLPIYGDGTVKAYFVDGRDIGKFTMKAADDVRTINKSVHFRPATNLYSMNELASLWEKKIGRTIPRVTVSEDDLLAAAAENIIPNSIVASFTHDIFIKGCQINFTIDGHHDLEISTLYPEESIRNLEDCFEDFVPMIHDNKTENLRETKDEVANNNSNTKSVMEAVPITAMLNELIIT